MKKILIGITVVGLVAAAVYFAGRTPAPTTVPEAAPAVAAETPGAPAPKLEAMVNEERLQRFMASHKTGPSPIEHANEAEWRLAAQKIKATPGSERQPANSK